MDQHLFDVEKVLLELGHYSTWKIPDGYPNSLALCVIDSIWSIGIRYETVLKVLEKYLVNRGFGGLPDFSNCTDGPLVFLSWYETLASHVNPEILANVLENRNRTSPTNGILKSEAVIQAMRLLVRYEIDSTNELLKNQEQLEKPWTQEIRGQSSGISWKYLLMLCGQSGVKPDRMVLRFMERFGIDETELTPDEFVAVLVNAVGSPKITASVVDHQIWMIERSRANE